jgi:hypothetical protein
MKKKKILMLTLIVATAFCRAQVSDAVFLKVAKENSINKVPKSFKELEDNLYSFYENDIEIIKQKDDKAYYNNALLNLYFKNIITSYATNTGDLSFENFFANVNSTEKTLTLGKSFRFDNFFRCKEERAANKMLKPIKKLGNLFTIYGKMNYDNGFATIASEQTIVEDETAFKLNSTLGIGFKYTHIFNGTVSVLISDVPKVKKIRQNFVKDSINDKIKTYEKSKRKAELDLLNIAIEDTNYTKMDLNSTKLKQKKFVDFYKAILDQELRYAKSEKIIKSSRVRWISLSTYIPIKGNNVNYSSDNINVKDSLFMDYNFSFSYNYLFNLNTKGFFKDLSSKLTVETSVFHTNSFIASNTDTGIFRNIVQTNGNNILEESSKTAYLGSYEEFWARSLKGEFVVLLFNNSVGLSAAGELIFGDIENRNWKLGIPFSLKDKDGKPTVNFELQWREVSEQHFVGLSLGYNFGKFVK